jgi:hypothetical protein
MFPYGSDGAPLPVLGSVDEARSDRVVEDVREGCGVMLLVVDDPGGEPLGEERAGAPETCIVLAGVVALEPLNGG